jgi:hypothetical protein
MIKGTFSENVKISVLNVSAANAVDCDVVDMSKFNYGAFVVIHNGSTDTDLTLSLYESDDVGESNTAAVTTVCPIYEDVYGTSSDVLTKGTSAYAFAIDPATEGSYVGIMEIDPAILSQGYPCVYLEESGGSASNTVTILWVGDPKIKAASLASAIA